jgi:hypothetical protein
VVSLGALNRKTRIAPPITMKAIFRKRGLILLLGVVGVMVFVLGVEELMSERALLSNRRSKITVTL